MENTAKHLTPKKVGKGLLKWVLYLLVMTIFFAILNTVTQGWPLFFSHPDAEDLQCVAVTQTATGETMQVDAASGDLEFTAALLSCLSYTPFSQGEGEPAYTLDYSLKDGSRFTIGINETSVFYQGRSHALKMEDFPYNAVEGVLFQ